MHTQRMETFYRLNTTWHHKMSSSGAPPMQHISVEQRYFTCVYFPVSHSICLFLVWCISLYLCLVLSILSICHSLSIFVYQFNADLGIMQVPSLYPAETSPDTDITVCVNFSLSFSLMTCTYMYIYI